MPTATLLPGSATTTPDVALAAAGDRVAFGRLVDASKQVVTAITLGIVRDPRASEDVAQEVYVQAWRDLRKLENPESFLPWIRQLARNEAVSFMRSQRRRERRFTSDDGADAPVTTTLDTALAEEERLVLAEALDGLPDDAREVLTLFYREGQSVKQVAELLGLSENAVKKRLERGRVALKKDVESRFAELVSRTAPGAAFTGVVLGALTFGAPTTAAAAVAGTAAKAGLAATLTTILAPLVGFLGGAVGPILGARRIAPHAKNEAERRELRGWRNRTLGAVLAITAITTVVPLLAQHHALPAKAVRGILLGAPLFFVLYFNWVMLFRPPQAMKNQMEARRAANPAGHARMIRLRNRVFLPMGAVFVVGLYAYVLTR